MKQGVSVIICCYNSENTIHLVLDNIQKQVGVGDLQWEVILVDNASVDRTQEVARKAWISEIVELRVVYEEKAGLSHARQKGLNSARYSVIVFVDDDNILDEHYIAIAFDIMESNPSVGLAGGLGKPVSNVNLPSWFKEFESAYAVGPQAENKGYLPEKRTYLHGAGIVMRKRAWDLIKDQGFTFTLHGRSGQSLGAGEDSEITYAFRLAGFDLWYDPDLRFEHIISENRLQWRHLLKLAHGFGKSAVILDIYKTQFGELKGWNKIKRSYWLPSVGLSLVNFLRFLPGFIHFRLNYKEGHPKEFQLHFHHGYILTKFQLIRHYPSIRRKINKLSAELGMISSSSAGFL